MKKQLISLLILSVAVLALVGCPGYNLEGRGSNLPQHIQKVGIVPFENNTNMPTLAQIVTEKVYSEFVSRGNFSLSNSEDGVDAVLRGEMTSYSLVPRGVNDEGEATSFLLIFGADVQFVDVVTDTVLWQQSRYRFRQEYQLSDIEADYVNLELEAVRMAAEDFSTTLANAILTGF